MNDRFQILALDGGGIKGIYSAATLTMLEDDLEIKIVDHFDLIVGTSTGGIIALGLALGFSPKAILEFYVEEGPRIFKKNVFSSTKQWIRSKYNPKYLKEALKRKFDTKRLADCNKRLCIPSYNIGADDVYLFRTPHNDRLIRDYKNPIWQVAMATSAAPTYFPAFEQVDNTRLVDGGVWANNPTMVGLTEAIGMGWANLKTLHIFNLGTTSAVKHRSHKLNNGGFFQWRKDAVEVIMQGQSLTAYNQAKIMLGTDNIFRLSPKVPDGLFKLDRLSVSDLLGHAAHDSRKNIEEVQARFTNHTADVYIPLKT